MSFVCHFTRLFFLFVSRTTPKSHLLPPVSSFMMTSSEHVTSPLDDDDTKSAFREIKPRTPRKFTSQQDQMSLPQKCVTSIHRLMASPCNIMTSQIKDEQETALAGGKVPPEEVTSLVFHPIPVHPKGQCNC